MDKMAETYRPTLFTCTIYGNRRPGLGSIELATWLEQSHG